MNNQHDINVKHFSTAQEMEGAALTQEVRASTTSAPAEGIKEPVHQPAMSGGTETNTFASFVHAYVWSSITFAEQKGAFIIALDSALAGYLAADGLFKQVLGTKPQLWGFVEIFGAAAIIFLASSMCAVVWGVMPRMGGDKAGVIYFLAIAHRPNSTTYISDVFGLTDQERTRRILHHCYELSTVCCRKYLAVRIAISLTVMAFVAALIYKIST